MEGEAAGDELRLYGFDGEGAEHEIGVAAVTATPDDGAMARMAIHARLHEAGAPLGTAQRTQFACDYKLMTAHTNFLLTLDRAAGDKAQAMPELQRVAHMLPAGWGRCRVSRRQWHSKTSGRLAARVGIGPGPRNASQRHRRLRHPRIPAQGR